MVLSQLQIRTAHYMFVVSRSVWIACSGLSGAAVAEAAAASSKTCPGRRMDRAIEWRRPDRGGPGVTAAPPAELPLSRLTGGCLSIWPRCSQIGQAAEEAPNFGPPAAMPRARRWAATEPVCSLAPRCERGWLSPRCISFSPMTGAVARGVTCTLLVVN